MIVLNAEAISQAARSEDILQAVSTAMLLQESGDFIQPDRMHMDTGEGTLLLMPSGGRKRLGIKVITLFENNINIDLPVLQGLMLLYDGENGKPLAMFDGARLTALRTAAVGATGVQTLAAADVTGLGIVGLGVQGVQQALMSLSVRPFKQLTLVDRDEARLEKAAALIHGKYPEVDIYLTRDSAEMLSRSDVVITATNATSPVLPDDSDLLKGRLFVGIGSYKPNMREFPDTLFKELDHIFVDTPFALEESGDLIQPMGRKLLDAGSIQSIGKVLSGELKWENSGKGTILFKSVGMALFDLMTANTLYEDAMRLDVGQLVDM